ncbi:MAG TPA: hypothetical protein ENN03_09185 [bacterium]|nr:hypothetical protein [bacterium]
MRTRSNSFLAGLFLIVLGALFLIGTLGVVDVQEEVAAAVVFFSAGLVLLLAHVLFQKPIWTLIVGVASVFIGLAIFISETRVISDNFIGALFFILAGSIFLSGLRKGKKNWWVIIPGGYCFVFAGHVILDMLIRRADIYHGVWFFAGSGLIFGTLYFLKDRENPLDWAKFPSLISLIIAGMVMMTGNFTDFFSRVLFPVMLILVGAYVIYRSIQKAEAESDESAVKPTEKKEPAGKKKAQSK